MANGRIVFELDTVLLGDTIVFTQAGKQFSLFHRINTQVGFHIQVNIQHVFGVTRLFGYHAHYFFGHSRFVQRRSFGSRRRSGLSHRGRRRYSRGSGFHVMRVNGVYFIHKRLGAFHHQSGLHAMLVVVFNAKGVLHHFQHGGLLAGNFFQPSLVFGFVGDARFAFLPHFFQ